MIAFYSMIKFSSVIVMILALLNYYYYYLHFLIIITVISYILMCVHTRERDSSPGIDGV